MSLCTIPAFEGQVDVSTTNAVLHWREDNGTATIDLSVAITSGTYWIDDLLSIMSTAMSGESVATGYSNTYSFQINTSGIIYCERTVGTATFTFLLSTTNTNNILRGKDLDSNGTPYAIGQYHWQSLGWVVEASPSALGASQSATRHFNPRWKPDENPREWNDGNNFKPIVRQSVAHSGRKYTYKYTDWKDSVDEFPLLGDYNRGGTLSFSFLSTQNKQDWITDFWGWYGTEGRVFRYFPDYNDRNTYYTYQLTGSSLEGHGFETRDNSYTWWSGSIVMGRYNG